MSEYQYYEFLAIDRPLSAEDIAYVRTLSRRVQPTPSHAVFTYSYGDFPGDPLQLLAKHYDAMLYLTNWGTKQLAFRFPRAAIDAPALNPYYFGIEQIEVSTTTEHLILSINFEEEDAYDWIEGEGLLASLVPLRDDLLRGDLRALYLAWLAAAARAESDTNERSKHPYRTKWDNFDPGATEVASLDAWIEPPVPPGLGQLSAALRAFMQFIGGDPDVVVAAAMDSTELQPTEEPYDQWVPMLAEDERNAFLVRVACGDAVRSELLRRLRTVGGKRQLPAATTARRSFTDIATLAQEVRRQRESHEREAAWKARLARLEALAKREPQVWLQVEQLLAKRTASGYDEAVTRILELRELALHRAQTELFASRLQDVLAPYATSTALRRRLRDHGLA